MKKRKNDEWQSELTWWLTLVGGDLAANRPALECLTCQLLLVLLQLLATHVDCIDLQASIPHACIDKDVAEQEEDHCDISLTEGHQLVENAKVKRFLTVDRGEPEAHNVDSNTGNDQKEENKRDLEGGNQELHVHDEDDVGEDERARTVHVHHLANVVGRVLRHGQEDYEHHQDALPSSVDEPAPEDPEIEVDVLETDAVEPGSLHQYLTSVLFVPSSEPDDRDRREEHIVGWVELEVVDLLAWKQWEPSIEPDRDNKEHILVDHVRDCVSVSPVILSAVVEQQVLEEAKLTNRVVGCAGCLLTF